MVGRTHSLEPNKLSELRTLNGCDTDPCICLNAFGWQTHRQRDSHNSVLYLRKSAYQNKKFQL